jgi:general secretion pathway protein K
MGSRPPHGRLRQRGFALVAVLWASMMLAIIVASLMSTGRTETLIARNRLRMAGVEASADAAMNDAILRMLSPDPLVQPPTDGSDVAVAFAGVPVRVSVLDEAGKIDLNVGDGALLTMLMRSVGVSDDQAQAMSDRIQDWRAPSSLHRLSGAGEGEYRDAGTEYGPRRGPFLSVQELRLVLGMDPALFDRIAPSLTVTSGTPWVDPAYSDRDVLLALANLDEGVVQERLAARARVKPPGVVLGHAFTITAQAEEAGVRVTKRAVIRLTGNAEHPLWIYSWDRVSGP